MVLLQSRGVSLLRCSILKRQIKKCQQYPTVTINVTVINNSDILDHTTSYKIPCNTGATTLESLCHTIRNIVYTGLNMTKYSN